MFKNSLGSMRRQKIHDEAEEERDVENTDYGSMHFERHSDNAGPKGVAEAAGECCVGCVLLCTQVLGAALFRDAV